jgi:hypothetical protein
MRLALLALGLFAAAFLVHWLLWKVWMPRRQILGLLVLFLGLFPVALLAASASPDALDWPVGFWQWLHVGLFYVAVALAYIVVYSILEQDSPSLTVVAFVAQAGPAGRTAEELHDLIGLDFIVGYRFESMLHGKLVEKVGERYVLTAKGRFWARAFRLYRRLFRLQLGG